VEFPASRFVRAGATPDEIETLRGLFDELGAAAQQSYLDQIAPLSDYALGELVRVRRDATPEPEPAPEPEPEASGFGSVAPSPDDVPPPDVH
jgi:hypothetical protein